MLELEKNDLHFRFPDVHRKAKLRINFQRTLRIPDDGRTWPLPPGLGTFPMELVDDHAESLPPLWSRHGGLLMPMYQAEAMWISFDPSGDYPFAVKVATGKINAVTGDAWQNRLSDKPQDYMVVPKQPWLDGFASGRGVVRQFVAAKLGQGDTVEEQLTGKGEHGGLQIIVAPMKAEVYSRLFGEREFRLDERGGYFAEDNTRFLKPSIEMGFTPGGRITQTIIEDEYGIDVWDMNAASRCFVHVLNSNQWATATGLTVPTTPVLERDYTRASLPWFSHYTEAEPGVAGSARLAKAETLEARMAARGSRLDRGSGSVPIRLVPIGHEADALDGVW